VNLNLEAVGTERPPVIIDRPLTPRDRRVRAQFARQHADQMRVTREALALGAAIKGART
jgi:hypothetical protein